MHRSQQNSGTDAFLFHYRWQMMNCLSRRAEVDVPAIPALPAPMVPALPIPALPMPPVVEHVAVLVVVGERVGIVGADELGPTVPTMGNTPVVGTAGAELTPRLLISIEPNGIPVRAPPPGVVGDVDVDVGVDDAAMLLEPEPHVPDVPDVSSIPEDVDIPAATDGIDICDDVDVPGVVVGSVVAAVAGAAVPAAVPPPSKLAVDPNIPDDEVPTVEHVVPLLVMAPLVGVAIVPVTLPVGAGLTPSDGSSVAPIGIPVPPTDASGPIPNGEVAPSEGVAVSGSSTWANAGPAHSNEPAAATIKKDLMEGSPITAEGLRDEPIGRCYELRTDRIFDRLLPDPINPGRLRAAEFRVGSTRLNVVHC
jgi:hypothetical protein